MKFQFSFCKKNESATYWMKLQIKNSKSAKKAFSSFCHLCSSHASSKKYAPQQHKCHLSNYIRPSQKMLFFIIWIKKQNWFQKACRIPAVIPFPWSFSILFLIDNKIVHFSNRKKVEIWHNIRDIYAMGTYWMQ